MPRRQISRPEHWKPVWAETPNGGRVLTFTPPGDIRVAVPCALLDEDYVHLARLWVLEPRGQSHSDEWTLLGKSVLFSDDLADELIETENEMVRGGQKIFGRKVYGNALRLVTDGVGV